MEKICPDTPARNPLADVLAEAIVVALTRPDVIEAMRTLFAKRTDEATAALLDKTGIAIQFAVSTSTVDRWVRAGCPYTVTASGKKRFDLGEVQAWNSGESQHPRVARAPSGSADISDVIATRGLRVVRGAT
jgi:hypothetical protein